MSSRSRMSDFENWAVPADSQSVVPELLRQLDLHSPALATQLRWYLGSNQEPLDKRRTHDGVDSTAALSLQLLEALLCMTKIRLELLDQVAVSRVPGVVPAHLQLAFSGVLELEPVLLHAATTAMELHLQVWNSHAGATPWSPAKEVSSVKKGEDRGRWGRAGDNDG